MPGQQTGEIPVDDQMAGEQNPQAVLAAYKSNIPALGESSKSAGRGRPAKMITRDDQLDDESGDTEEENKTKAAKTGKIAKKTPIKPMANKKPTQADIDGEWLNNEGQLAIDVYQTETDLVVQAAIAGIKVEDLDVLIEDEVITIKGSRPNPLQENGDYFIEECYWGDFSRKIILPVEVDSSRADAAMKEGILNIRIPKIQREKKKKLVVK